MKVHHIIKFSYYIIITGVIIGLGTAIFFLYNHFYRTISQAEVVYLLKNQVAFDTVDINLWNKVYKHLQDKKTSRLDEASEIVDPFIPFIEMTIEIK